MDHEIDLIRELEPDDLKQIPGVIGSDSKDLRRVGVRVEVDDGERVIESVEDGAIRDSVLASRPMDLHIRNIVIRNCEEGNRSVIASNSGTGRGSISNPEKC